MSGEANFTRLALCDVLADALKASAERADARECYQLAALAFRQIGVAFPPPTEQGGEADAGRWLAIAEAEQERFLERLGRKREWWRNARGTNRKQVGNQSEASREPICNQSDTRPTISTTITTSDNTLEESAQGAQFTLEAEEPQKPKRPRTAFTPPTADEVRKYAEAQGLAVDAAKFVDHYAAQGWKINNGLPMKDWRAAVRTWARRDAEWNQARPKAAPDMDEARRMLEALP